MIETKEFLKRAGISIRTLQKYRSLDILPPPCEIKGSRGKGTKAYYPDDIFTFLNRIRDLKARGLTLEQIRESFEKDGLITWFSRRKSIESYYMEMKREGEDEFMKTISREGEEIKVKISPNPFKTLVNIGKKLRDDCKDMEVYDLCWKPVPRGYDGVDIAVIIRLRKKER